MILKKPNHLAAFACLLSFLNVPLSTAFAQGSLTPPGPPGPTMLTLSQVEPRTPISSLPFTITTPGSYYLTGNLSPGVNQNGIIVAADNVTIDLNGFTLSGGGGGSGEAIWAATARQNVVIRNGTVRNWPGSGVNLYDSGSVLITVENIQSISNGFTGIAVWNGSHVKDCLTVGNGIRGILVANDTVVEHCKASGNLSMGIGAGTGCQLLDNLSETNGTGLSIAGPNNIVSGNIVRFNTANYSIVQGNQLDLLLCQVPETISWPAHVKLAGSLSVTSGNAITITANNVTLDLNGFTISSTENPSGPGSGILINGAVQNIAIVNGFIQSGVTDNGSGTYTGSGFGNGILDTNNLSGNVRVRDVSVSGCRYYGIFAGVNSTVVESCTVRTVGYYGIVADVVKDSTALDCGIGAINCNLASSCQGQVSGSSEAISGGVVQNCYGSAQAGEGISANVAQNCDGEGVYGLYAVEAINCKGNGSTGTGLEASAAAQNCSGASTSGTGLVADSMAENCDGYSTSGVGLSAYIANACYSNTGDGSITYKYNMP